MSEEPRRAPGPEMHSPLDPICLSLSTLGFVGKVGRGPGTAGSAVAVALAPALFFPHPLWLRLAILAGVFVVGGLAAGRAEKLLGAKDPGSVVIDELAGQWLVFAPFAAWNWWLLCAGFVLFRIFDIAKPWPVKASESWLPGGFGVMVDDLVAGALALVCLWLTSLVFPVPGV